MSSEQNWKNMGEQIKASVSQAIQTGDYSQVNRLVSDTVNNALREARNQAAQAREQAVQAGKYSARTAAHDGQERERNTRTGAHDGQERERNARTAAHDGQAGKQTDRRMAAPQRTGRKPAEVKGLVRLKRVGSVSGVLYMVFGGIGMGLSVCGLIAVAILCMIGIVKNGWLFGTLLLTAGFGCMIRLGANQDRRLKRAERYIQLCGNKMYGVLDDFSRQTGKSVRFIRKDIRKMLEIGMFPEGHLDERQTCFMLNDVIYHQYTRTEDAYRQRQEEQKLEEQARDVSPDRQEEITAAEENSARENELNAMIAEGMECIRKLKELNDRIEDQKISQELLGLENLLKEIFDSVREHPEQMHRMHKLMDYYLPTTVKLVEAYEEFDQVSVPGEDILAAKAEIEKTLGVINDAFAELLNTLFRDAALDVTTDAQVLQTMLAKEGLTGGGIFARRKRTE